MRSLEEIREANREVECSRHGNLFVPPDTCDACDAGAAELDRAARAMVRAMREENSMGRKLDCARWLRVRAARLRRRAKGGGT